MIAPPVCTTDPVQFKFAVGCIMLAFVIALLVVAAALVETHKWR